MRHGTRSPVSQISWITGLALVGLVALYVALTFNVARFAYNGWLSVLFLGELDYAEGIVWQQAELIPGPHMYGDIQQYPFLVFHYPPLYHVIVNAAASLGWSWLAAGRAISMLSLLATAVFTGLFVKEASSSPYDPVNDRLDLARHAPVVAGLVAGLLIFSLDPLRFWARVARVDMLACAFEVFGMYLGLRALRRGGQLHAAAFVFLAALFTKQTVLMGAAATFMVAFYHDWRGTLRAAVAAGSFGVAVFIILTIVTHGGFPRHIILYNVNRFSLSDAWNRVLNLGPQNFEPAYIFIAVATLCGLVLRWMATGTSKVRSGELIVVTYFVLTTVSLVSLGKSGAYTNYFIPWMCGVALLNGLALANLARVVAASRAHMTAYVVLTLVLAIQALVIPPVGERRLVDLKLRRESAELVAMITKATRPVFSENMVLLLLAGKDVPWEPAIITELTATGAFDERRIIDLINARTFAFVIENDTLNTSEINARYSEGVRRALEHTYPVILLLAGQRVLMPETGSRKTAGVGN
jgi:hypothetical protein